MHIFIILSFYVFMFCYFCINLLNIIIFSGRRRWRGWRWRGRWLRHLLQQSPGEIERPKLGRLLLDHSFKCIDAQSQFRILLKRYLMLWENPGGSLIFVFYNFYCVFIIKFLKVLMGVHEVPPPFPEVHLCSYVALNNQS
jgi:hypothetical protein